MSMDPKALREQLRQKYAEAKKLADEWKGKEAEMPGEVSKQIDGLLGETDVLKARLSTAEGLAAGEEFMRESTGTKAAHLGWREAGMSEGEAEVDPQSWREIEIRGYAYDPQLASVVPTTKRVRFNMPLAVMKKDYPDAFEAYLRKRGGVADMGPNDRKTLSEGIDSAGGFMVPPDYHVELIRKMATMATVRANARVVQTSRDIAQWPKIHYTTNDEYTSGVRMTWTGETPSSSTAHRVTEPVFGLYSIPVHTAMASLPLTNALLEDSAFDIVSVSSDLLAEAFALGENDAFWNGDGIAKPMGILTKIDTNDGPASVDSGTAAILLADGILDLWGALPSQYERNAKWYMNKATEVAIRKMTNDDGDYIWPVWTQGGGFAAAPRELLGFPTVRDEFLPDVAANAYPVVFGDLSGYLVLDRVGLSVQRLSELYAETDVSLILARKRVGGQLIQPWRVKVQKVSA